MRCLGSWLVILRSSAMAGAGMQAEYSWFCKLSTRQPRYPRRDSSRSVALRPALSNGLPGSSCARVPRNPLGLKLLAPKSRRPSHSDAERTKPLAELLTSGSLADLTREAERRRLETVEIRKRLPADEGAHLVSAATNEFGELVLVMDSPSWAARVRYCLGALPTANVRIKVLPRGG